MPELNVNQRFSMSIKTKNEPKVIQCKQKKFANRWSLT